jgi:hypothetical protein
VYVPRAQPAKRAVWRTDNAICPRHRLAPSCLWAAFDAGAGTSSAARGSGYCNRALHRGVSAVVFIPPEISVGWFQFMRLSP